MTARPRAFIFPRPIQHVVRYTDDPGGFGREVVRELALCAACAAAVATEEHHPRRNVHGPPLALAA